MPGSIRSLAYRGRISYVGNAGRGAAPVDVAPLMTGNQSLTVLDPHAATTGGTAKLGQITVGKFPRELSRTRSGSMVFLANWDSNSVTVFDAARLRGLVH